MLSKEPLPSLDWEFQQLDKSAEISDELLDQFLQVCVNGFGFESDDWTNDNREKLATSTILGKLLDDEGQLYGISFYSAPAVTLSNSHILWEDGICLVKSAQHQGYSQQAIVKAFKGTSINSHLIENSYGRAALSAFVRLQ